MADDRTVARGEIECWRGQCLDKYSRIESAIGKTLESAQAQRAVTRIPHLAGQRLCELEKLAANVPGTNRQKAALTAALDRFRPLEHDRAFIVHGVMTVLLDERGMWWANFDIVVYGKAVAEPRRRIFAKKEAIAFYEELSAAFAALSREVGQLRKRLEKGSTASSGEFSSPVELSADCR